MSVLIKLESKKYCCELKLNEKITFIQGDSGQGKTEFTRRAGSENSANKIIVSNGFKLVVLTKQLFEQSYNMALRHNEHNEDIGRFLKKYWSDSRNFPYENSIIVVDDEDFVKSPAFATYYHCDKSNYYIIINRAKLPNLSYSADEIYRFVADGKNHYIEKYYQFDNADLHNVGTALIEGSGSDFIFFTHLFQGKIEVLNPTSFGNLQSAGRSNVVKLLELNYEKFLNRKVFVLVDFCAFGSDMDDFYNVCLNHNLKIIFEHRYLSFEYMLLKSNMIHDEKLDFVVEKDRLKYHSLEDLFTNRLNELTLGTYYSYSKSVQNFPICYYENCCKNSLNRGDCRVRMSSLGKNKLEEMLKETEFEYFLEILHRL